MRVTRKKALLYLRSSLTGDAGRNQIKKQEAVLRAWCNDRQIEIEHVYSDFDAQTLQNRLGYENMAYYARLHRESLDYVLTTTWDRVARTSFRLQSEIQMFECIGIRLQAILQPLDLSNPDQKAILSFLYPGINEVSLC
ncbi:hypothetical protein GCM10009122_22590 [Fulvivirga kasyanovii]|uniref:Recombinase family protein n=1 Tax=Fulvivirga kasyanovii TaxID=396812 RepID=A0ABW9RRZ3_9BACT|nr:recombinase family protein [Fulvivirga kasyanovii]MTI25755.1 recombinase family protein [Fulvivirga kasyanovii]